LSIPPVVDHIEFDSKQPFQRQDPLFPQTAAMMPKESIFQPLQAHDSLVEVPLGSLVTLELADNHHAVRARLSKGEHCFILMGTVAGSAVAMSTIAAILPSDLEFLHGKLAKIPADVDYMISVRRVLAACFKRPDLYQASVAWLFSSDPNSASCAFIRRGISKALQHLCIELRFGQQSCSYGSAVSNCGCTVVAVRHPMGLSEVYVDGRLAYPKAPSGALAFVKESLEA
jgi:hypothetical protein